MTRRRPTVRFWSMTLTGARALGAVVLTGSAILGGCGVELAYLLPAAAGQARILLRSGTIERAMSKWPSSN